MAIISKRSQAIKVRPTFARNFIDKLKLRSRRDSRHDEHATFNRHVYQADYPNESNLQVAPEINERSYARFNDYVRDYVFVYPNNHL